MLKLCRVTEVKVFFLVVVDVFNFDLFEFSAAILEIEGSIRHFHITISIIRLCSKLPINKACSRSYWENIDP